MEADENTIVAGKQTVVKPEGQSWAFHLPAQHRIRVSDDQATASLSSPASGGAYNVREIREDDEEVRIVIATGPSMSHASSGEEPGYRFPEIHEELARLKGLYVALGGSPTKAEAWAPGANYDSHTTGLRREIRQLRRDQGA